MTRNYYITILFTAIPMMVLIFSCEFGSIVGYGLGFTSMTGYILAGFFLGRRHDGV